MEDFKLYKIGGCVRDFILGLKPKDIDYVFVFNTIESNADANEYYLKMKDRLLEKGVEIFQERPDCFTIRGKYKGEAVDFVMARKEKYLDPKSRIPTVVVGTLEDDQTRRDFTVNALAMDEDGNIIDLFNGQKDLQDRILKTPTDVAVSFNDDPLRILRAMRFAITKGLDWSDEMWRVIDTFDAKKLKVVSLERKREELFKCFKHDTKATLQFLRTFDLYNSPLYDAILPDDLWLEPTNKK